MQMLQFRTGQMLQFRSRQMLQINRKAQRNDQKISSRKLLQGRAMNWFQYALLLRITVTTVTLEIASSK
jgi:hypothetical protein